MYTGVRNKQVFRLAEIKILSLFSSVFDRNYPISARGITQLVNENVANQGRVKFTPLSEDAHELKRKYELILFDFFHWLQFQEISFSFSARIRVRQGIS